MSYSFFVRVAEAPKRAVVLDAAKSADEQAQAAPAIERRADVGGPMFLYRPHADDELDPELLLGDGGGYLNVYVPRKSAAGVEVGWDAERGIEVRVMALASREDYTLGIDLAKVLAVRTNAQVETQDGERFPPQALGLTFGEEWVVERVDEGVRLATAVKESTFIQTPLRPFYLGPDVRDRLVARTDAKEALMQQVRLLVAICHDAGDEDFAPARILEYGGDIGKVSAWDPANSYLFHPVDHLSLMRHTASGHDVFLVPWAKLPKLAGKHMERFDEEQVLISTIPVGELKELYREAKAVAVEVWVSAGKG